MPYLPSLQKPSRWNIWLLLFLLALILWVMGLMSRVRASEYTNDQIANAIYYAEGGDKTSHPYGIKSIPTYGNKEYARKICLNTIRNQRKRHAEHNCGKDFLTCLWHRYCPPVTHKLNKNWLVNVKFYLVNRITERNK